MPIEFTRPYWKHDCKDCTYLGTMKTERHGIVDMYFCPQWGLPTLIGRMGNDPADHQGGADFPLLFDWQYVALGEAIKRGLLTSRFEVNERNRISSIRYVLPENPYGKPKPFFDPNDKVQTDRQEEQETKNANAR